MPVLGSSPRRDLSRPTIHLLKSSNNLPALIPLTKSHRCRAFLAPGIPPAFAVQTKFLFRLAEGPCAVHLLHLVLTAPRCSPIVGIYPNYFWGTAISSSPALDSLTTGLTVNETRQKALQCSSIDGLFELVS